MKDHTVNIMSDAFDKQSKAIAENSIFNDLVKKKPNDWFSEWENIVKKVDGLSDSRDESLFNMKRNYKSVEEYVLYHNAQAENELAGNNQIDNAQAENAQAENGQMENNLAGNNQNAKVIQSKQTLNSNLADVIVKSMLSDPKYDALRYTVAMKPEKEAELFKVVKDYIKDKKPLGSGEVTNKADTLKKIASAIKSTSIKSDIVKKFADREKRLARENRSANANVNKNANINANIDANVNANKNGNPEKNNKAIGKQ